MIELPKGKSLILFDGYCHLCSGVVQRILKYDSRRIFVFAPLESEVGMKWRAYFQIPDSVDSIILIEKSEVFVYTGAVLKIAGELGGIWRIFQIGYLLPKNWRDAIYRSIARNRRHWFGRRNTCWLPDDPLNDRFL